MGYLNKNSEKWIYNDGSDNGNKLMPDGSIRAIGTAIVWNDIIGDIFGKSLSSTIGKVDYDWNENAINFQSGGNINIQSDVIQFNFQFPHSTYFGSDSTLDLHIHWWQDTTSSRIFTIKYRIQHNGDLKNTTWKTVSPDIQSTKLFTYTSGTLNQISQLIEINIEGYSLSDIIQFKVARTDSNIGDCLVQYIDGHVQIDSDGSQEKYLK